MVNALDDICIDLGIQDIEYDVPPHLTNSDIQRMADALVREREYEVYGPQVTRTQAKAEIREAIKNPRLTDWVYSLYEVSKLG